jgi:hypothetical protein
VLAAEAFEPQLSPGIAVAAAIAAVPPLLFWGRIAVSEWKRQQGLARERQEAEGRERARLELKRKLTGKD